MTKNAVFVSFLELLKVKHTESFANQRFNEHPHKNNLYGLSKMLTDYGVDNAATCIEEKEKNITEIQTHFVAQFSGDFVAVHKVDSENVTFIWKGVNHVLAVEKYIEAWTGIVLLAGVSEKSIEPDYKKHKKAELINLMKKITLFLACGLMAVLAFIHHVHYINAGISLLLTVNLAGLYISGLLLLKQMRVNNQYVDKIYRIVFALIYMQFDKRRLTAGYFKLHRLLYFIRAVAVCPLQKQPQCWSGRKSVASSMLPPVIR
jgi:hypothetical protein